MHGDNDGKRTPVGDGGLSALSSALPEEAKKILAAMALEQMSIAIAHQAMNFARDMDAGLLPPISAPQALREFAYAILRQNDITWPKGPVT